MDVRERISRLWRLHCNIRKRRKTLRLFKTVNDLREVRGHVDRLCNDVTEFNNIKFSWMPKRRIFP